MKTYLNRLLGYIPALLVALTILSAAGTSSAVETITYFHNDIAGTPILATDAAGAVLWKENYRPYGDKLNNPPAGADNKLGFTGKPYDPNTGLSYMGARYYDPVIGRFAGIDPLDYDEKNLHSFNRYTYANNNPYKYVDPDGRQATLAVTGMGVLVIGYIYYISQPKTEQERLNRQLSIALGNIFSQSNNDADNSNEQGGNKEEAGKKARSEGKSKVKPDREQRPEDVPANTKPVDQDKRLDREKIHDIKDQIGASPKDWVGIDPKGNIWINEAGKGANQGPYTDYIRSSKDRR